MPHTTSPISPDEILDREFSPLRSRLLDIAAALDRLDRAAGIDSISKASDHRISQIRQALQLLLETSEGDRVEQIQKIFSRQYDAAWYANWIASNRERISMPADSLPAKNKKEEA